MIVKPNIPAVDSVTDLRNAVQLALDKIIQQLNRPLEMPLNGGGRKITNVAAPTNPTDVVNLQTLERSVKSVDFGPIKQDIRNINATLLGAINIADTHANRLTNYPAAAYQVGALFLETDRHYVYTVQDVSGSLTWVYIAGEYHSTYTNLPSDLTTSDAGAVFAATDVYHKWVWQGSNWAFDPSDPGSGWIAPAVGATIGLWALCDGSASFVYNSTAGTSSITTPNLTGDVFIQGGTTGSKAASSPTWGTGAVTGTAGTHTHTAFGQSLGNTGFSDSNIGIPVGTGSLVTVANNDHTHDTPDTADADTSEAGAHTHALGTNALLNPPSETNGGLPARYSLSWYVRR